MTRKSVYLKSPHRCDPVDGPDLDVVCDIRPECAGCPYPRHGFICHFSDGSCMKSRFDEIMPPYPPDSGKAPVPAAAAVPV